MTTANMSLNTATTALNNDFNFNDINSFETLTLSGTVSTVGNTVVSFIKQYSMVILIAVLLIIFYLYIKR